MDQPSLLGAVALIAFFAVGCATPTEQPTVLTVQANEAELRHDLYATPDHSPRNG